MAELDRILGEAQETHKQMQEAAKSPGERAVRDIVRLRTRFATLVAEMMGAIKGDTRLQARRDVAGEFESHFFEMRQALAQHQSKWRSANIDAALPSQPSRVLSATLIPFVLSSGMLIFAPLALPERPVCVSQRVAPTGMPYDMASIIGIWNASLLECTSLPARRRFLSSASGHECTITSGPTWRASAKLLDGRIAGEDDPQPGSVRASTA